MLTQFRFKKISIFLLIVFFISCSAPARKSVSPDQYNLTVERAKNINWAKTKIKLVSNEGTEYEGHISGWTGTGFIIKAKDRTDTLAYADLRNYMLIDTGKNNKNKGARYGLYAGIGAAALSTYLILSSGDDNNNPAPGPEPLSDDTPSNDVWRFAIAIGSAPLVMLASAGIGAIIGSTCTKYERYYFNKDDFAGQPYTYIESPEPVIIENNFK